MQRACILTMGGKSIRIRRLDRNDGAARRVAQLGSGPKWKRLPQLLDDPTARRMLGDVKVQDVPPIMSDDEEAVEYAERDRWHCAEIHGRNRFPMVSKERQPALGRVSGSLGARLIQREMFSRKVQNRA